MTDTELLEEIKDGLGISGNQHDKMLNSKILAVKNYMVNGGVTTEMLATPLAIAVIIIGVTDLWNLNSGEIKFSLAFNMLLEQLAVSSL